MAVGSQLFNRCRRVSVLLLVLSVMMVSLPGRSTVFFSDDFTAGSTLNQVPATPTAQATSYQTLLGGAGGSFAIAAGDLTMAFPNSGGILGEVLGVFTNSPVMLTQLGNYLAVTVVFTNTANILDGSDSANASLNIGLFNSGGVAPNQGNIQLDTGNTNGGTQGWIGYIGRIYYGSAGNILTRPAQTANGNTSQNQDLLFSNQSGSQGFNNPTGASLGGSSTPVHLTSGSVYTLQLGIAFASPSSLVITNALWAGAGAAGTPLFVNIQTATNATFLTSAFDSFAIGWRNVSSSQQMSVMDIVSVTVDGTLSSPLPPPQPVVAPVLVATNGSCAFIVTGLPYYYLVTYQWHRNGTNLMDGGNISGAQGSMLVISPAGPADELAAANGYSVTVTGPGNYTLNSATNPLTLIPATNLVWSGAGNTWDINTNTSPNWFGPDTNATLFNFGDPVIFDDTGAASPVVNLAGSYLSASSVVVDGGTAYTFTSSGSFAGPGNLVCLGNGVLTISNVNTYSGGTIISNPAAWLRLANLNGLGTGPITLAKAGGRLEIIPSGSATYGIPGDMVVSDDFTVQLDGSGLFAGVFFGNLSGNIGKTLTITMQNMATNGRVRVYGTNTVMNANLVLNGAATDQANYFGIALAPYQSTGIQSYNGIISGNGGLVQRGTGMTILNAQNTYTGGTTPTAGVIALASDSLGSSGPIGTGPLYLTPDGFNLTGSGMVLAWGGARSVANPVQYPSATNNLTLIVGGTNALTFTGPITLNGNDGTSIYTSRIFQITNTALTTFAGPISDGGLNFGLTKTGNGILALNSSETYTGPTTVSAGTLQVNGALAAGSSVVVSSGATLSGTGTINGAVTVNAGAALAPGIAVGLLTINSNLTINGNLRFKLDKSLNPSNDAVFVSGTLINSGAGKLTLTNLGPALAPGDRFTLFNQAMTGGSALRVSGAGAVWANNLADDGSVSVVSTNLPAPTFTGITLDGTNLVSFGTNAPAGYDYYVLVSTNLTTPLSGWQPMATNSFTAAGFTITNFIRSNTPSSYYLLVVP